MKFRYFEFLYVFSGLLDSRTHCVSPSPNNGGASRTDSEVGVAIVKALPRHMAFLYIPAFVYSMLFCVRYFASIEAQREALAAHISIP